MSGTVKEEEIRCPDGHDKHDPAGNHEEEQDDDVAGAKDIQGDVAWTHLGFGKHFGCVLKVYKSQ